MLYLFALVFAFFVQDTTAVKYICNSSDRCGCSRQPVTMPSTLGSVAALQDTWSWSVSLRDENNHFCDGSILNERYIITAAHCLVKMNSLPSIAICAGTNHLSNPCRQRREMQHAIIHPFYNNETHEYDIALIRVRVPFNFTDTSIARICLPTNAHYNEYPQPGTDVITVSWGRNEANQQQDTLRQAPVEVLDEFSTNCDSVLYNYRLQICATASGKDNCQDDGSDLLMVFTDSKRWELVGIRSYGQGCTEKHPGVYTRITAFINWIQQYVNNTLSEPSSHTCSCECPRGSPPSTAYTTLSSAFACVDSCKAVLTNPCESSNTYACLGTNCAYSTSTGYSMTGNGPNTGVISRPNDGRYEEAFNNDTSPQTDAYNSSDGRTYVGDSSKRKNIGQGIFVWPNGDQYVGQYKGDKRHGKGTLNYANKEKYIGDWNEDRRTGRGILTWPDGNRYEGSFQNDVRTGRGIYHWPNGNRYVGEFKDGKMHGTGALNYTSGETYIGNWIAGKRTGRGVLTSPDGNRYEGEFKDDKKYGKGTLNYATEETYVGDWIDDRRMGRGVLTWPDGHRYDGEFQNDTRTGQGVFIWPNGNRYQGQFKQKKMHGTGTLNYANGEKYVGNWVEGKRTGHGVFSWPNGRRYDGQFKDDKKHGPGKMIYANGEIAQGSWLNDAFDG